MWLVAIDKCTEKYKNQVSFQNAKKAYLENFRQYFGENTLLVNIRYVDVETHRNHLRQKPTKNDPIRTNASVNREMSCFHHILSKATEWEMMEQNPFDKGESLIL